MKKIILIFSVIFSLLLTTNVAVGNSSTVTSALQCTNVFYPNTRYAMPYSVSNKYVNGVLCYANWYTVNVSMPTSVYALNNYTCQFDRITSFTYSYFLWTPF